MRAVSFVKRLQWDLPGTVFRHGLTIGDLDNDGDNELVVGTAEGEIYIFKGSELWQKITGLGLITSVAIGDIFNYGRNALVVICGDGWAHIFYSPRPVVPTMGVQTLTGFQMAGKDATNQDHNTNTGTITLDIGANINVINTISSEPVETTNEANELSGKMECVHVQRIPTNTKVVLVADIDRDGANEMVIGLTDRVVRSYRWSSNVELGTGKLVGLNKWECANQIGTVTMQHTADGTPALLVAQPGGTFMRIKCSAEDCSLGDSDPAETGSETAASCVDYQTLGISRMRNPNISTEIIGDLEPSQSVYVSTLECDMPKYSPKSNSNKQNFMDDTQIDTKNLRSSSLEFRRNYSQPEMRKTSLDGSGYSAIMKEQLQESGRFYSRVELPEVDQVDGNLLGGNVILGEFDAKAEKKSIFPSYKDFSRDNNNSKVAVETSGDGGVDAEDNENSTNEKPYALATLDGTIMLVKDEVILWAMQVDHQIFALCRLDVTGDGTDEIVACTWDGQTYILDQQRNSVRFQFEEPVRAFCTGQYNVIAGVSTPCLVYNTFNNKIFLYYDVLLPSMIISSLDAIEELQPDEKQLLEELLGRNEGTEKLENMKRLTEWLLYGSQ